MIKIELLTAQEIAASQKTLYPGNDPTDFCSKEYLNCIEINKLGENKIYSSTKTLRNQIAPLKQLQSEIRSFFFEKTK